MLKRYLSSEVRHSQEFQSAIIRIAVLLVMMAMVGFANYQGAYSLDWALFFTLFGLHLLWFLLVLLHVIVRPAFSHMRTYIGVTGDMSATSFLIYLTGNPISPFYLAYIWSFLSQGTRFGRNNLIVASVASVLFFTLVATVLGGWSRHPTEISFMLLFLVVLPAYQYSLLNKLHAAKLAAEAANRARGNFLATMTHELRTPLSGVIGMAGLLNDTSLDEEQKEYLESINASARVLQSLIGDILDLSKIDAGKLELKSERFDLRNALVETVSALSNQALDKEVELSCWVDLDVPRRVHGDQLRFRQILFNLVGNAVKFTERGQVTVCASLSQADLYLDRPHLIVSVTDTGIGIDKIKLGEIFDSFWQADSSTTRRYGGTGLGTTIARDLTQLMGGVIGVESEEGVGSRFWIKVPLLDRDGGEPPQPPEVLKGRRILILDYNVEYARAVGEACEGAGMQVVFVTSLEELGGVATAGPVDLMLISDSPKGVDLLGIASMLRGALEYSVPVLYLHYARRKFTPPDSRAATLSKPFNVVVLWDLLAQLLEPDSTVGAATGGARSRPVEDRGIQVLVAEDDSINAKLISSLLRNGGYHVTLVRDGQAALAAAQRHRFDIALVDLRMPKMDGIDFTRQYREREVPGRRLPIIALTANAAEDAKADCMAAGMDEFLTKPVDPQVLNNLMRQYTH
jgi:two-component system, sensor histidine kinase RpfC